MAQLATKAAAGVQLDPNALMHEARRRTSLSDFGDPWFVAPFKSLIHFVNTEGGLPSEDVPPVQHVINMLCERLRLTDYLKRHPKVLDEKLDVVGAILGQARGGSTLTQRLTAR